MAASTDVTGPGAPRSATGADAVPGFFTLAAAGACRRPRPAAAARPGGRGLLIGVILVAAAPAWAGTTERASVGPGGRQANGPSFNADLSFDGRYVAFESTATDLLPGATNGKGQVYLRDRQAGKIELVSVGPDGAPGDDDSGALISISGDGRYVAFTSDATNLVPGDTNGAPDAFVRDRVAGVTTRVSVSSSGAQANGGSGDTMMSADGRYVVFDSIASNLVPGDTNGQDVFVHDRQTRTTERVSVSSRGTQANSLSWAGVVSSRGRYVLFTSDASNLVPGDTNGTADVFVRDRRTGKTKRVSVSSHGAQGRGQSDGAWLTGDGRYALFGSYAANLVPGDTNGEPDVFVRDLGAGTTERVSVGKGGAQANGSSGALGRTVTRDGRYVVFLSAATNLVPGDTNGANDVFVRDRKLGTTERVSVPAAGGQANGPSIDPLSLSGDGRFVAFTSEATNLVKGDTNGTQDVFVRTR